MEAMRQMYSQDSLHHAVMINHLPKNNGQNAATLDGSTNPWRIARANKLRAHKVAPITNTISGLPQIQDFEIQDFFKTFSGPEIIFFKTANDRNFIRAYQKI